MNYLHVNINRYINFACRMDRNMTLSEAVRQAEMEMLPLGQKEPAVLVSADDRNILQLLLNNWIITKCTSMVGGPDKLAAQCSLALKSADTFEKFLRNTH